MGLMFGKIIPMDLLAQMPLPFVRRLRDIRIKQIEEANKQQEAQMRQYQTPSRNSMSPAVPQGRGMDAAMFNGTPYEDIIDELSY